MMIRGLVASCLLATTAAGARAADAPAPVPVPSNAPALGEWLTATHDGVILMYACGDKLCGRIDGMQYDGTVPVDVWKRSKCHEAIMGDLTANASGAFDGHILDPDSGKSYAARVHFDPETNTLKLRGYIALPLFGQTETWTRYQGPLGPECHMPADPPA